MKAQLLSLFFLSAPLVLNLLSSERSADAVERGTGAPAAEASAPAGVPPKENAVAAPPAAAQREPGKTSEARPRVPAATAVLFM